jgi:hypothetical protein
MYTQAEMEYHHALVSEEVFQACLVKKKTGACMSYRITREYVQENSQLWISNFLSMIVLNWLVHFRG